MVPLGKLRPECDPNLVGRGKNCHNRRPQPGDHKHAKSRGNQVWNGIHGLREFLRKVDDSEINQSDAGAKPKYEQTQAGPPIWKGRE